MLSQVTPNTFILDRGSQAGQRCMNTSRQLAFQLCSVAQEELLGRTVPGAQLGLNETHATEQHADLSALQREAVGAAPAAPRGVYAM